MWPLEEMKTANLGIKQSFLMGLGNGDCRSVTAGEGGSILINIGSNSILSTVIWALSLYYAAQPELTHAPEFKEVSRMDETKGVYHPQAKTSVCLSGMASFNTNS